MEKSVSRNVRLVVCSRHLETLTQIANYASVSMDTPNAATLLEDIIYRSVAIS